MIWLLSKVFKPNFLPSQHTHHTEMFAVSQFLCLCIFYLFGQEWKLILRPSWSISFLGFCLIVRSHVQALTVCSDSIHVQMPVYFFIYFIFIMYQVLLSLGYRVEQNRQKSLSLWALRGRDREPAVSIINDKITKFNDFLSWILLYRRNSTRINRKILENGCILIKSTTNIKIKIKIWERENLSILLFL